MNPKKWFLAFFVDGELPQVVSKTFDSYQEARDEYDRMGDRDGVAICETIFG